MATPSVHQKISQRVKNANLKLTTDSGTHLPFMKRVNSIIKEFDAEKAVELFFRAPWQDEPRRNKPIESARVRAAILDLSKEDFKSALEQTPMEKKKVEIATSILTGAIPTDYDFLWEEKDHPVKIYSSLGHELFPGDANATNELWDELDDLDFADCDQKVSKLTAAINRIHKRLKDTKDCGEDLSTGRKVAALIKALKPKSKHAQIIFEMKKQTWASFTKAQSRLESLLKTWADLQPSSSKQTAEEAIVNTNGNRAPSGSNSEALMHAQIKKFMNSNRNQAHAQRGGWRGRRGGGPGAATTIAQDDGRAMNGKGKQFVAHGRRVVMAFPGGAGYGDPAARSKDMVKRDLARGYISAETDRKSTRLNSSHVRTSRMPSSA